MGVPEQNESSDRETEQIPEYYRGFCTEYPSDYHPGPDGNGLERVSLFSLKYWVILPVRIYQLTISPMLGDVCRFEPSCSHYFVQAVKKYGVIRGTLKGIWRILRCHPFCRGGFDPP